MIGSLNGTIAELAEGVAIVEVGGVGFEVLVSSETASRLAAHGIGADVKIYTYTHVREDALLLYGFLSRDELNLYKLLITVNGVGPKAALALLSALRADELRFAIVAGNAKTLAAAPGVGKKTAERLILDLRDKLQTDTASAEYLPGEAALALDKTNGAAADAIQALAALGYPRALAVKAVQSAEAALTGEAAEDTEEVLKEALRFLD